MYTHGGFYNLTGPRDCFLTWVEYNILSFQKNIFKGQIYCALVTQIHQASKGNLYLLTSYNVDDVTERAPRDDNDIVTLMAQGVKQDFNYRDLKRDFILIFATSRFISNCKTVGQASDSMTTLT